MSEPDLIEGLRVGADGCPRCAWAGVDALYCDYHDREWGRPSADEARLFEKLCLEGFQAGLSWITILRKREAFRELFEGFDIERVARFNDGAIDRIAADARIIRHRGKVSATVNNARATLRLRDETGTSLAAFLWSFEPKADERPKEMDVHWIRANPVTPASTALSKALRKRGFNFVGPTTMYAFMQSMGFVNDHLPGCHVRAECEAERQSFKRPG